MESTTAPKKDHKTNPQNRTSDIRKYITTESTTDQDIARQGNAAPSQTLRNTPKFTMPPTAPDGATGGAPPREPNADDRSQLTWELMDLPPSSIPKSMPLTAPRCRTTQYAEC